ncbi:formylglycine-generating enzyme family protein [Thiocapsa roseopersicina]|uniref:Formylglycine-generating enzyme, required for sulfatase activity, contains SUMF1/FGE domain n=1 Tax=Thiocapsa roseopersicina TaxID=1058 RepID=A0A1H2VMX1_THIRO|nr:formylglycine-generating enzyme family protein [Thiocapsa roseopersicina]SDW69620.1 Formylglycine-generating enzyme, required for sulfatase activity, contains SUMF1/FGE domain [Thiocapsa roseopersicina]
MPVSAPLESPASTFTPPIHPNAICGRADLVRALAHGDDALLAAVAAKLGYERRGGVPDRTVVGTATEGVDIDPTVPTGDARSAPAVAPSALDAATFWRLVGRTQNPDAPPSALDDGPVELPTWRERPAELARARPLAEWRELLPRLRVSLAGLSDIGALDIAVIVRRLGRGESLHQLPRARRRRWGQSLQIIEDRSDHLVPYWDDQEAVRHRLQQLFPRYAVEHALWFEGLKQPVWAEKTHRREPYRPPIPGSLVVVLGDLGCLLRGAVAERRHWLELGRRLRADRCRILALTPAPRCPAELQSVWTLLTWERHPAEPDDAGRKQAVQRLLALAGNSLRLEPGLLRELRLLIGADAGAESEVWQDPSVVSRSAVAATLSPDDAEQRRKSFLDEPSEIRQRVMALQRSWRAGLPSEIWFAELQALTPKQRLQLASAEDGRDSSDFISALGRQAAGVRGASPAPGAMAWFRDVAPWLRRDYLEDPELRDYFHYIWADILRRDPRQKPPAGLDPARVPIRYPVRRVNLSQVGDILHLAYSRAADVEGSPLAFVETSNGFISVQAAVVEAIPSRDSNAFWEAGEPPTWAKRWGWDEYGAWVEFEIEGEGGDGVTQRMRWIEPGSFMMGSPEDEPERSDSEGPRHEVAICDGFWLFDTACTQALWAVVTGDDPSVFKGPDRPVERVSWDDARLFIDSINSRLPGLALGLPSEAKWEYACRAGTDTPFSFAETAVLSTEDGVVLVSEDGFLLAVENPISPDRINYNGKYTYNVNYTHDGSHTHDGSYTHDDGMKGKFREETLPVKALAPNGWGLYQMHGNVWEWTQDHWHDNYAGAPSDGSAWTDASVSSDAGRVVRGGCWASSAGSCRSAFRLRNRPDNRSNILGFRPARTKGCEHKPAQPRERSVVAGSDGPEGGGLGSEQATEPQALVLLLDGHHEASAPLSKAARLEIRTDREVLTLRRAPKPGWASAIGRDRFGLWADLRVEPESGEPVIQRLRWIPPGRFEMGSPEDEPGRFEYEGRSHTVVIERGYWLFDTPCTQALWEAVMGKNPSRFRTSDRPVERVSWSDAQDFLERLNKHFEKDSEDEFGQQAFALPGEAQWEYACRAGTDTALYTGSIEIRGELDAPALDAIAWYGGNCGLDFDLQEGEDTTKGWWEGKQKQYDHRHGGTRRVKQKQPNPWGLYDMLGNVWEWTQDHWRERYVGAPTDGTPWIDANAGPGAARVVRGGSWYSFARNCRSAYRLRILHDVRRGILGFRPARVQVS